MKRYWITPPDIMKKLDDEFHFDFDPCPCPRPDGYNSLVLPWGHSNYVNPPFCGADGPYGGPTAFVHKAIDEQKKGKNSVLILPVRSYINLLLEAGAELRSCGRVKWLDIDTKKEWGHSHHALLFILRGVNAPANIGTAGHQPTEQSKAQG